MSTLLGSTSVSLLSEDQTPNGADCYRSRLEDEPTTRSRCGPHFSRSNRQPTVASVPPTRLSPQSSDGRNRNCAGNHLRQPGRTNTYVTTILRKGEREGRANGSHSSTIYVGENGRGVKVRYVNSTLGWTDRHGWLTERADSVIKRFIASHVNGQHGISGSMRCYRYKSY